MKQNSVKEKEKSDNNKDVLEIQNIVCNNGDAKFDYLIKVVNTGYIYWEDVSSLI